MSGNTLAINHKTSTIFKSGNTLAINHCTLSIVTGTLRLQKQKGNKYINSVTINTQ